MIEENQIQYFSTLFSQTCLAKLKTTLLHSQSLQKLPLTSLSKVKDSVMAEIPLLDSQISAKCVGTFDNIP